MADYSHMGESRGIVSCLNRHHAYGVGELTEPGADCVQPWVGPWGLCSKSTLCAVPTCCAAHATVPFAATDFIWDTGASKTVYPIITQTLATAFSSS